MDDDEKRMEDEVKKVKLLADMEEREEALKTLAIIKKMLEDEYKKTTEPVQETNNGNSSG